VVDETLDDLGICLVAQIVTGLFLAIYVINQQMHIYKYIQSHIIILHQHVSVTPVSIIRLSYNKNTINIQIIVKTCTIKPLDDTFNFL